MLADQLKVDCGTSGFHGTQIENSCNTDLLSVNLKVRGVGVDAGIILKRINKNYRWRLLLGSCCSWQASLGGLLWKRHWTFWFDKGGKFLFQVGKYSFLKMYSASWSWYVLRNKSVSCFSDHCCDYSRCLVDYLRNFIIYWENSNLNGGGRGILAWEMAGWAACHCKMRLNIVLGETSPCDEDPWG